MEGNNQRRQGPLPRTSASLSDLTRTPLVDNFLSLLPGGHEKALKYAFYNVLAMVLSAFVIAAFWAVYCILEPFIKPLLWAGLVGTVLHPFKAKMSEGARKCLRLRSIFGFQYDILRRCVLFTEMIKFTSRNKLHSVQQSSTPFSVHILTTPCILADTLSEKIGTYIWSYWKSILGGIGLFFLTYILYYNPPLRLVSFGQWGVIVIVKIVGWSLGWVSWRVVVTFNVVYVGYIGHWMAQRIATPEAERNLNDTFVDSDQIDQSRTDSVEGRPTKSSYLRFLPYTTWLLTVTFICLQLPYMLLVALFAFVLVGTVTYLRRETAASADLPTIIARIVVAGSFSGGSGSRILSPRRKMSMIISPVTPAAESSPTEKHALQRSWSEGGNKMRPTGFGQKLDTTDNPSVLPSPIYAESIDEVDEGQLIDTNKFLYGVLVACMIVQVWNRLWILHLLPIPVVYYGIKRLCSRFGFGAWLNKTVLEPFQKFYFDQREGNSSDLLFPAPLRVTFKILSSADRRLVTICETYLDPFISILVLVLVVMATILGLIFAATQVYAEGDHLVRVGVNLINSTVSQHPEINKVLPEGWQSVMDSMVENAYLYGRESITNMVRDSISEKSPEKAEMIERQVIELWDRIYLAWNQTWAMETPATQQQPIEWDDLLQSGKEMPHLLELSGFTNYARANVGTIWSVMDSLWNILIGNISLVISAVTAVGSLLFGGGTAILNLMLNLVVFFTALFYLLSSSTATYKPVELFNSWTPGTQHANNFALAVEDAVNGVFTASFKMAAFYGMWTWLIHTLFQVNIVFIPSIFATLFGAVPFLAPYWAALPAVLELWLIQGHWPKAILMILAQMAPMSIVDTQIYSEIKGGGHPYLTGLAVAGGIFCFGMQGAIMGPVVLCCFVVAVKIGTSFLREGGDGEASGVPELGRSQRRHDSSRIIHEQDTSFSPAQN